jgi:DNA-binding CsgD family transcriptional regulator
LVTSLDLSARQQFVRLIHRNLDLGAFFDAANGTLDGLVEFDSSCWLSLDPSTLLPTSHFTFQVPLEQFFEMAVNEFLEDDFNKFSDIARSPRPVALLSQATHGDLAQSSRFNNILSPNGYGEGDELRSVFLDGQGVWGCLAAHRHGGTFREKEADLVADISGYIAEGIRRAILATTPIVENGHDLPGLILIRENDSVESMTPSARHWLREVIDPTGGDSSMPLIVMSLAVKARQAFDGTIHEIATARVPRRSGGWLLMHAAILEGDSRGSVAVMLHPAKQPEIASLIVEAYGLSTREREVARLVLAGLSTQEMAESLHISPYTVQDHLKAIFAKVGVHSRRELVAQIFMEHYAPRLKATVGVGSNEDVA